MDKKGKGKATAEPKNSPEQVIPQEPDIASQEFEERQKRKFIDVYFLLKEIAYGGNAVVNLGLQLEDWHTLREGKKSADAVQKARDSLVAIKMPYKIAEAQTAARIELSVLRQIKLKAETEDIGELFPMLLPEPHECGSAPDGIFWIAMNYIEGVTLDTFHRAIKNDKRKSWTAEMAKKSKEPQDEKTIAAPSVVPIPYILHIFLQLGAALKFLHSELGYAHGDVKEANIILREPKVDRSYGDIVLVDFGSARCKSESGFEVKRKGDELNFFYIIKDLATNHDKCGGMEKCQKHSNAEDCWWSPIECHPVTLNCKHHPEMWEYFLAWIERALIVRDVSIQSMFDKFETLATEERDRENETRWPMFSSFVDKLYSGESNSECISNAELEAIWKDNY